MCCERLVRVELYSTDEKDYHHNGIPRKVGYGPPGCSSRDWLPPSLNKVCSNEPFESSSRLPGPADFSIVIRSKSDISKLFRTCRESRQAAKSFYRVHIPCYYKCIDADPVRGILYLHPELDIVDFPTCPMRFFARFAHWVWVCDPRRAGLFNICVAQDWGGAYFSAMFEQCENELIDLLRQGLSRLRQVIFRYDGTHTRIVPGHCMVRRNRLLRSVPLQASVSKFERLPQDPRMIEEQLKLIFIISFDPRDQMYRWFRLLEKVGVELGDDGTVDYRFMMTVNDRRVQNREEARLSLEEEAVNWEWY